MNKEAEPGRHILIVEDEAVLRLSLRQALEGAGYRVSEAHSTETLMAHLDGGSNVDLITLDLSLGEEDGLELASTIRQQANIPLIMLTARAAPFERVQGLERGADDYIVKPFLVRNFC